MLGIELQGLLNAGRYPYIEVMPLDLWTVLRSKVGRRKKNVGIEAIHNSFEIYPFNLSTLSILHDFSKLFIASLSCR